MEDKAIVELYWKREEQAIAATQNKYGAYCRSIAYRILENNEDADECVADTWLAAWNAIPPARPDRLAIYLGKTTRNLALHRIERERAAKRGGGVVAAALAELAEVLPASIQVEDEVLAAELRHSIERFLYALPAEKRHLFVRRYWHLSSVSELAADFGMRKGQVATTLFRVRAALKQHLEQEGFLI